MKYTKRLQLRNWLLRQLAGKDTVVLNAHIIGALEVHGPRALIAGNYTEPFPPTGETRYTVRLGPFGSGYTSPEAIAAQMRSKLRDARLMAGM